MPTKFPRLVIAAVLGTPTSYFKIAAASVHALVLFDDREEGATLRAHEAALRFAAPHGGARVVSVWRRPRAAIDVRVVGEVSVTAGGGFAPERPSGTRRIDGGEEIPEIGWDEMVSKNGRGVA